MVNLIETINAIQSKINSLEYEEKQEIEKLHKKYQQEKEKYNNALHVNMELNEACLKCEGKGICSYTDAAGDTERESCSDCLGSGKKK